MKNDAGETLCEVFTPLQPAASNATANANTVSPDFEFNFTKARV
jgi:hypothetical protein